jgi:C4-dicarboxylate-specific signal transduction histidine kinase
MIAHIHSMAYCRTLDHAPIGLNEVVREAVGLLQNEMRWYGVEGLLDLAPGIPNLAVDRVQLRQIVVNLASNAIQVMSQAETAYRRLVIRTRLANPEILRVEIEASGSGVVSRNTEELFKGFFTVRSNDVALSLAICRSIIKTYGGKTGTKAETEGIGAQFWFTLPTSVPRSEDDRPRPSA